MSHAHSIGVARKLKDIASRGNLNLKWGGGGGGGDPRATTV